MKRVIISLVISIVLVIIMTSGKKQGMDQMRDAAARLDPDYQKKQNDGNAVLTIVLAVIIFFILGIFFPGL